MKRMTFFQAMMDFFGKKPSQTNLEFMKEVQVLSPTEREYFKKALTEREYEITPTLSGT